VAQRAGLALMGVQTAGSARPTACAGRQGARGRTMAVTKKAAGAPVKGSKKKTSAFVIDCSKPVEDKIMEIGAFEKFLVDKIKVDNKPGAPCVRRGCACPPGEGGAAPSDACAVRRPDRLLLGRPNSEAFEPCSTRRAAPGRAGVLGDQVRVTKDKTKVTVTSESEMSKRCARAAGLSPAWEALGALPPPSAGAVGASAALSALRPLRPAPAKRVCGAAKRVYGEGDAPMPKALARRAAPAVTCTVPTCASAPCGRYLKYLTKKFLKKHNVRDWLRVIASNKDRRRAPAACAVVHTYGCSRAQRLCCVFWLIWSPVTVCTAGSAGSKAVARTCLAPGE